MKVLSGYDGLGATIIGGTGIRTTGRTTTTVAPTAIRSTGRTAPSQTAQLRSKLASCGVSSAEINAIRGGNAALLAAIAARCPKSEAQQAAEAARRPTAAPPLEVAVEAPAVEAPGAGAALLTYGVVALGGAAVLGALYLVLRRR